MNRKNLVLQYFQKKQLLTVTNASYAKHITDLFLWMIQADDVENDMTKSFPVKTTGTAEIISKQSGIIAGIEEITYLLKHHTKLSCTPHVEDGAQVSKGQIILTLTGNSRELLGFERTLLNILGRMSGIATFTHNLHNPSLAATRKTPWMLLDKKAVAIGGGLTHRLSLSDFALIKDTHLALLKKETLEDVVKKMVAMDLFFEIEVQTIDEAFVVTKTFEETRTQLQPLLVMAIMLDNVVPKTAATFVKKIQKNPVYPYIIIEASGEITKKNLPVWEKTGVDVLSMGSLTHSAPTFNFSMTIV